MVHSVTKTRMKGNLPTNSNNSHGIHKSSSRSNWLDEIDKELRAKEKEIEKTELTLEKAELEREKRLLMEERKEEMEREKEKLELERQELKELEKKLISKVDRLERQQMMATPVTQPQPVKVEIKEEKPKVTEKIKKVVTDVAKKAEVVPKKLDTLFKEKKPKKNENQKPKYTINGVAVY